MHLAALLVQFFGHGVRDGAANAAAHHGHFFQALGAGGPAQRPYEVVKHIARLQVIQLFGRCAHHLKDHGDAAFLPVKIRHGQWDPLAVLVRPQNDELPGFRLAGDERSLHLQPCDRRVERLPFQDPIHAHQSPLIMNENCGFGKCSRLLISMFFPETLPFFDRKGWKDWKQPNWTKKRPADGKLRGAKLILFPEGPCPPEPTCSARP